MVLIDRSRVNSPLLVIILVVTFLHNFAFNSGTFYLALYFQVRLLRWGGHGHNIFIPGGQWLDTSECWHSDVAILTWIFTRLYARCMAYWICSDKNWRHCCAKMDHYLWASCLYYRIWYFLLFK